MNYEYDHGDNDHDDEIRCKNDDQYCIKMLRMKKLTYVNGDVTIE